MKTYKAPDSAKASGFALHVIDPAFERLLPSGSIEVTESEALEIETQNKTRFVPNSVTMRQARLALLQAGKLQYVINAIQQMQGIQGEAARIEWEYSSEVKRSQALTVQLALAIGMTSEEMDQLFITAARL